MEQLKINLIKACQESQLSIEAILFVVKDVYRDVTDAFYEYKAKAAAAAENEKSKPEEDNEIKAEE